MIQVGTVLRLMPASSSSRYIMITGTDGITITFGYVSLLRNNTIGMVDGSGSMSSNAMAMLYHMHSYTIETDQTVIKLVKMALL